MTFQMGRRTPLKGLAAIAALALLGGPVFAQADYPVKPITVIVGTPPGVSDQMVRMVGDSVQAQLGQPLVVINRVGANGVLAVNAVINAQPDGYTLMFGSMSTMTMNPFVYSTAKYNASEDLAPVAQHTVYPMLWAASKKSGIRSIPDMIRYAKQNPEKFFVGHIGEGGMASLVERNFFDKHGIKPVYVTYQSNAQTVMALQANDIQVSVEPYLLAMPQARQGLLTPLAVTTHERNKTMPEVPSSVEGGLAESGMDAWFGFFAPKGTPPAIVNRLNAAINKALMEPKVRQFIEDGGGVLRPMDAAAFTRQVADDYKRFSVMIPASGVAPK